MYIDRQFFGALWLDLYDSAMQKWKIVVGQPIVLPVPGLGLQNSTGAWFANFWDLQKKHAGVAPVKPDTSGELSKT
jgi:hypothetical protein